MSRFRRVLLDNRCIELSLHVSRRVRRAAADVVHDARLRRQELAASRRLEPLETRLNEIVLRLYEDLVDAKKYVATAIADEKRLAMQREQETAHTAEWEKRAKKALELGNDDLAREADQHRRQHAELRDGFDAAWKNQVAAVDELKRRLRALNDLIEEAKRKKTTVLSRNIQAEAKRSLDRLGQALIRASETLTELQRLDASD